MIDEEKINLHFQNRKKVNTKKKKIINYNFLKILLIFFFIIILILISKIKIIVIEIDNEVSLYEKNIDFSNYSTDIRTIALYLPQFHTIIENDKAWGKGFTEWTNVKKALPLYKNHHQPRIPGDKNTYLEYYELTNPDVIKKQVELAKSHGIYGFGIYYYWFSGKRLLEKPLNIFIKHKEIIFKFLIIWANENWTKKWDGNDEQIIIKQEYKENDSIYFIKDIRKYLKDERYIKINGKPIIGIYEPFKIPNLNKTIYNWRKESKKLGIGKLFILVCLNHYKINYIQNLKIFDGVYEFPPRDSLGYLINNQAYYLYTATLYKDIDFIDLKNNFYVYRGSMLEFDNTPRKKNSVIFEKYSPEQFYMINKKIISWTREKYNKENWFIFINAWNEWGEGTYLEPDDKYGYASINSLSKALFNLPYKNNYLNKSYINNSCIIIILVYMDSTELIKEIIDKTNNIPINFDLYFIINNYGNYEIIVNNINKNSKANNFEIINYEQQDKNISYMLLKNEIKKYKYICNIEYKMNNFNYLDNDMINYILNNLLGSEDIIIEIINEFEYNNKLGLIYPETYYKFLLKHGEIFNRLVKIHIKYLLKKNFYKFKFENKIEVILGNMFWAKIDAIYSIFDLLIEKIVNKSLKYKNKTLFQSFEYIWLYIVKLNGFYYKKIFKHF